MGKSWDSDKGGRDEWITWMTEVMRECEKVLKPGAHALVWAIPRTSHWTTTAIENAGFEIRDVVTHLFGSGFPKSLDISKAIDKEAGAKREVIGKDMSKWRDANNYKGEKYSKMRPEDYETKCTAPATDDAKTWQGFGTALKPAAEFWILARKPLSEKTVAKNVLKHGTGALNIDGSRIATTDKLSCHQNKGNAYSTSYKEAGTKPTALPTHEGHAQGRFPANLVFSHTEWCTDEMCDIECAIKTLDEQAGEIKSAGRYKNIETAKEGGNGIFAGGRITNAYAGETGGPSRFFYCAKVSPSERNAGLEGMPDRKGGIKNASGRGFSESDPHKEIIVKNHHPTVKPIKLMQYLIKLVTPPGGTVLDPFMGSGSTGIASRSLGFKFIGIEKESEYYEIATKRIHNAGIMQEANA